MVVQEQKRSTGDGVKLALYTGTTLVPLQQTTNSKPLLPDATLDPYVASTASNLRARSILDSLVTTSLIGDDALMPTIMFRFITFVDILTVHVRDKSLYESLLLLTNGGIAYSVNSYDKRITLSETFSTECAVQPTQCAIRELMRSGNVKLPAYVHVARTIEDDVIWAYDLFRDEATSPKIAQTFVENVYQVMLPNSQYRRVAWIATQYEWDNTEQADIQDNTLIFASFKVA